MGYESAISERSLFARNRFPVDGCTHVIIYHTEQNILVPMPEDLWYQSLLAAISTFLNVLFPFMSAICWAIYCHADSRNRF